MSSSTTITMTWAQRVQGSNQSIPINKTPSAPSQTLERALASKAVTCSCGASSSGPSGSLKADHEVGSIKYLYALPTASDSVAQQQPHLLNKGVANHPCAVMLTSPCGHLAFCAPVTSFNGEGIHAKYSDCHNRRTREKIFNEYLSFEEPTTMAHNGKGMLQYAGEPMAKQSYAHLEFGYWMELRALRFWGNRRLTTGALQRLKAQYLAAETQRQVHGSDGERRIAKSQSPSPPPTSRKRSHTSTSSGSSQDRSPSPHKAQRWAPPTPSPSPPPMDKSQKAKAMNGDWRRK